LSCNQIILGLCQLSAPRYNLLVVPRSSPFAFYATLLVLVACVFAGCATSLGPGYVVEKQEIHVTFQPQPQPSIHITAEYLLKNTGNQALHFLAVRMPGRRFNPGSLAVSWDGASLQPSPSPDNSRDTLIQFPASWSIGDSHSIRFAYDLLSPSASIASSADAFALPAEGWTPALPQSPGVFGFGGVPPKNWDLTVTVPKEFLVHASGGKEKRSAKNSQLEIRYQQTSNDLNPFVVAGIYHETRQELSGRNQKVNIWSRTEQQPQSSRQAGDALAKTLATYDSLFGPRGKTAPPLWIVECPPETGCIPLRANTYSAFLYGPGGQTSAEMISRDTVLVQPGSATNSPEALAAPALAAGWLGYGQNPGFYEQQPPMSALPAFAAALALEADSGAAVRIDIIQRALARIPPQASRESNSDPAVSRAKSFLLFYALRDRVGTTNFQLAMQHMLSARRARGFDVTDLISALEEQSHQPVGPFVRQWIKLPGVPDNFRALYSGFPAQKNSAAQEVAP
jgi:hypothetical protein